MWVAVALCSFGADVVHAGYRSWWHVADRIMSKSATLIILVAKPLLWSPCGWKWTIASWITCVLLLLVPAFQPVEILQNTFSDRTRCIAHSYGPDPHSC